MRQTDSKTAGCSRKLMDPARTSLRIFPKTRSSLLKVVSSSCMSCDASVVSFMSASCRYPASSPRGDFGGVDVWIAFLCDLVD